MAYTNAKSNQPPTPTSKAAPTMKVSDVIYSFRPTRRLRPDDPKTCVTSLDFDDSGELALVARDDETLQIYNCKEGKHAKELKSQKYGVHLARFTHHAQSIIYASTKVDDTIRYLSSHDNSYIRYFRGHTGPVTSLALSPASDHFLSCSQDNTVRLWALNSPSPQGQLKLHAPYLCAYDPSASVFAIASPPTQSVLLYDLRQYERPPFATFDLRAAEARFDGFNGGRSSSTTNGHGNGASNPSSNNANNTNSWTSMHFSNDGKVVLLGTAGAGHYVLDAFDGSLKFFLAHPNTSQSSSSQSPAPPTHRRRAVPGDFPSSNTSSSSALANSVSSTSRVRTQGDVCLSPDGRYALGGSPHHDGILVWDLQSSSSTSTTAANATTGTTAGATGGNVALQDCILRPTGELPGPGRTGVLGYNPRHNMIVSADNDLLLWLPDADAMT